MLITDQSLPDYTALPLAQGLNDWRVRQAGSASQRNIKAFIIK